MMKSSISDSIEDQSLPSIPKHRELDAPGTSQMTYKVKNAHFQTAPHYISTPISNRQTYAQKSFAYTSSVKQSKTPELNKINEYAVLKVYEHRNFGKTPSNYSRMSEDFSIPNLSKCRSFIYNRPKFATPCLRSHYYKVDSCTRMEGNIHDTECIYLPKLQPDEAEFLQLVTENNVQLVEKFLEDHPTVNINCTNFQGISPLHIAVSNRSGEMVEFLLRNPYTEIGDSVLHAVRDNSIKILVMLLDAQKKVSPGLEFAGATHSTVFPSHITPLILATQLNNYEIVTLLISRGHTITDPHMPNCDCINCKNCHHHHHLSHKKSARHGFPQRPIRSGLHPASSRNCVLNEDGLHGSRARLSIYQAISSPAYLVHVTSDPILEAFRLTEELAANAASYRHLAAEYFQLRNQVREFAVCLIDNCRTSNEVEIILKQTSGCEGRRHFVLPRLLLAVTCKQYEFVAHPNTQQVLESYWLGDWYSWRGKSFLARFFIVLCRIFMLPLILLFCIFLPRHKLLKHYQIPLNKLITHAASYFVFLALVFYISNQDKRKMQRGPPNTGAETPLILFVCGYTWSAVRMSLMQGPRRYFTAMWNWAEIITLTLFWLTFALWALAAIDTDTNDNIFHKERKYWNQYDPTLLAEGTFCLATIFAFFRLMFLCQLSYHLGPLQVSLGKMTLDIYKYVIVFAIIIMAFAAGLARFYQYYDGMVYEDQFGMKRMQVSSFTSLSDTLKTLFWALFCMAPLESADLVLENTRGPKHQHNPNQNAHEFTERVGYFCFGCFEVISVIVVLNMLIATMSNTFQRVTDNVAIEWTFGKTEVYIDYMWQTTLPSPFNLIPTTSGLASMFEWLRTKMCRSTGTQAQWSCSYCCFIERDVEANIQKEFPSLMSVLIQRYFSGHGTGPSDLETIRQNTNTIKCQLAKKHIET